MAFDRSFFLNDDDITHGSPANSKIEAVIEIKPMPGPVFGTFERAAFDPHIDVLPDGGERLILKVEHFQDEEDGVYRTQMRFLKSDGADDGPVRANLRRNAPLLIIPALRSAARDLMSKGGTWGRILGGVEIDSAKKAEVKKLARSIADQVMQLVLGDDTFAQTTTRFSELLKAVLWAEQTDGELVFSALPSDQREFLQAMQILIRNPGDVESVGIMGHGDGTQSIAVIALMLAYASAMGYPNAALAVEEPESHLHPHATRSLVKYLWNRPQQVIITTHSTHVTDVVSPDQVIMLKRRKQKTIVCHIPETYFTPQEIREVSRHIHTAGSEFFFAKCVLLTEGKTESSSLPIFARSLKINLDQLGISLLDVSGQNFRPFIRLFQKQALDTPYLIMCDNDDAVVHTAKILSDLGLIKFKVEKSTLEAHRPELEKAGLLFLPTGNFEGYVMSEGHVADYEKAIERIHGVGRLPGYIKTRTSSDAAYVKKSKDTQIIDFINKEGGKPELAYEVASLITNDGADPSKVPPYFVRVLKAIEALARQEAAATDGDTKKGA